MLKKLLAKLRSAAAPAQKPAPQAAAPAPDSRTVADKPKKARPARTERKPGPAGPRREGERATGQRGRERARDGDSGGRSGPREGGGGGRGRSRGGNPAGRGEAFPVAERQPAAPMPEVAEIQTAFTELGLSSRVALAVQEKGYDSPTPIQAESIPVLLAGRDIIGSAQTGTGKTAAFALPVLDRLASHGALRCLVLEPTRELALQVEAAFKTYSKHTNLRATVIYGGVGYGRQREDLQKGVDIVVATPGRLLDHLEQGTMSLGDVDILILDEVDRMLDMGFLPDVRRIVRQCREKRQTLFFTATIPPEIEQLAAWAVKDPARIAIGHQRTPAETVSHAFYPVVDKQKFDLLQHLLDQTQYHSVIIFSRTKAGADFIANRLIAKGHKVGVLHSDRNQRERVEALDGFKAGTFEVLVATDIAARGLDIAGVSHVINFDVPENAEDYVHRIGRTGRAQATGDAFTIVTEDDVRHARSIERFINASVPRKRIDGFEYIYSALFDEKAQAQSRPVSRLAGRMRR